MLAGEREVSEKKYPPEVNYSKVLKGMTRTSPLDTTFHALMAILLITGLIIDLLGPWLGGWLASIRSIAHGYIGALFVLVFILYLIGVVVSKGMRMVLTATNYVDFLLYIILVITGITIASPNKPWIDLVPGLAEALAPILPYAPMIHVTTTYVWLLFAIILPGGVLHGLASVYLISHLKRKSKTTK